jgi:CRISPR-associated endonuclease/helicase Cas3
MIKVVFSSYSTKRALKRTRQILDAYGVRIGQKTWISEIPEKDVLTIYNLLRETARKNTAVTCFQATKHGFVFMWSVGTKIKITESGPALIRTTKVQNKLPGENMTELEQILSAAVHYAACMHDVGKSSPEFQAALKKGNREKQKVRHEIFSALFAVSEGNVLERWTSVFNQLSQTNKEQAINEIHSQVFPISGEASGFDLAVWLISTHHKLPPKISSKEIVWNDTGENKKISDRHIRELPEWIKTTSVENMFDPGKIFSMAEDLEKSLKKFVVGADYKDLVFQGMFLLGRLAFMLADHKGSGAEDSSDKSQEKFLANPRQTLSFHLREIQRLAGGQKKNTVDFVLNPVERFFNARPGLCLSLADRTGIMDISATDSRFVWQNANANFAEEITNDKDYKNRGVFVCLASGTGSGKTRFGGRLMSILAKDESLRICIANGLKSLTYQTGDAYSKEFAGIPEGSVSVITGDPLSKHLYDESKQKNQELILEDSNSSADEENSFEPEVTIFRDFSEKDFPYLTRGELLDKKGSFSQKKASLLGSPILISTIDYLMRATNWDSGGSILSQLRILTSDIIFDEIDLYDLDDYPAITRLFFLIGLFGRRVILSSATLVPEIANELFLAYQTGWSARASITGCKNEITTLFCSDVTAPESTIVSVLDGEGVFKNVYQKFCKNIASKLEPKRFGRNFPVPVLEPEKSGPIKKRIEAGFVKEVFKLHTANVVVGEGVEVSMGVVRVARVTDCIELTKLLVWYRKKFEEQGIYLNVIPYHSNLLKVVRYETERQLDLLLTRKGDKDPVLYSDFVKNGKNLGFSKMLLVVVATPVEEVGRDHCFDWALADVSSTRSLIQLAGRVRRHRPAVHMANVGVFEYPFQYLKNKNKSNRCFIRPGFELTKFNFDPYISEVLSETTKTLLPKDLFLPLREVKDPLPKAEREIIKQDLENKNFVKFNGINNSGFGGVLTKCHQSEHPFRKTIESTNYIYSLEKKAFLNGGIDSGSIKIEYISNREGYYFDNPDALLKDLVKELCEKNKNISPDSLLSVDVTEYREADLMNNPWHGDPLLGVWKPEEQKEN